MRYKPFFNKKNTAVDATLTFTQARSVLEFREILMFRQISELLFFQGESKFILQTKKNMPVKAFLFSAKVNMLKQWSLVDFRDIDFSDLSQHYLLFSETYKKILPWNHFRIYSSFACVNAAYSVVPKQNLRHVTSTSAIDLTLLYSLLLYDSYTSALRRSIFSRSFYTSMLLEVWFEINKPFEAEVSRLPFSDFWHRSWVYDVVSFIPMPYQRLFYSLKFTKYSEIIYPYWVSKHAVSFDFFELLCFFVINAEFSSLKFKFVRFFRLVGEYNVKKINFNVKSKHKSGTVGFKGFLQSTTEPIKNVVVDEVSLVVNFFCKQLKRKYTRSNFILAKHKYSDNPYGDLSFLLGKRVQTLENTLFDQDIEELTENLASFKVNEEETSSIFNVSHFFNFQSFRVFLFLKKVFYFLQQGIINLNFGPTHTSLIRYGNILLSNKYLHKFGYAQINYLKSYFTFFFRSTTIVSSSTSSFFQQYFNYNNCYRPLFLLFVIILLGVQLRLYSYVKLFVKLVVVNLVTLLITGMWYIYCNFGKFLFLYFLVIRRNFLGYLINCRLIFQLFFIKILIQSLGICFNFFLTTQFFVYFISIVMFVRYITQKFFTYCFNLKYLTNLFPMYFYWRFFSQTLFLWIKTIRRAFVQLDYSLINLIDIFSAIVGFILLTIILYLILLFFSIFKAFVYYGLGLFMFIIITGLLYMTFDVLGRWWRAILQLNTAVWKNFSFRFFFKNYTVIILFLKKKIVQIFLYFFLLFLSAFSYLNLQFFNFLYFLFKLETLVDLFYRFFFVFLTNYSPKWKKHTHRLLCSRTDWILWSNFFFFFLSIYIKTKIYDFLYIL